MILRNLFLSAVASSGIVLGSDSPTRDGSESISSQRHDQHIHLQISTGFEVNHILDQGKFIEGNFAFMGIHAHLDHW